MPPLPEKQHRPLQREVPWDAVARDTAPPNNPPASTRFRAPEHDAKAFHHISNERPLPFSLRVESRDSGGGRRAGSAVREAGGSGFPPAAPLLSARSRFFPAAFQGPGGLGLVINASAISKFQSPGAFECIGPYGDGGGGAGRACGLSGPAPQHLCTGPAQRCTLELPLLALAVPGGPRPGLLMSR